MEMRSTGSQDAATSTDEGLGFLIPDPKSVMILVMTIGDSEVDPKYDLGTNKSLHISSHCVLDILSECCSFNAASFEENTCRMLPSKIKLYDSPFQPMMGTLHPELLEESISHMVCLYMAQHGTRYTLNQLVRTPNQLGPFVRYLPRKMAIHAAHLLTTIRTSQFKLFYKGSHTKPNFHPIRIL